jgi:hypothetical protein
MSSGKEISRKGALRIFGVAACTLCLPKTWTDFKETIGTEDPLSYITQKTCNSCSYAILAMFISDKTNENIENVYQNIEDYYKMIGKLDLPLGAQALTDFFKRERIESVEDNIKDRWQVDDLRGQLVQNGSTILNVTSNYGAVVTDKNNPNHWIILDRMLNINSRGYSLVRDPLHSKDIYKPLQKLKPFMIPNDNGSICVPTDILIPAIGNNYVYLKTDSENQLSQKRTS